MQDHVQFYFDEAAQSRSLQKRTIKLPEGETSQEAIVSPQRIAILYRFQRASTVLWMTWLHRVIPQFTIKPTLTEDLWISRADGQGIQEIGHVPIRLDANGNPESQILSPQWLPAGKSISFVYHGMLYVAPAEPGK